MRCFVAIDLSENIKEKITEITKELKKQDVDVKFVESQNLHITVKFLGEVSEEQVKEISNIAKEVLSPVKQFKINIKGLGYFGSPNYIRTLWVGISDGKEKLHMLIETVNKKLFHIRKEGYAPSAHITIGRVRSGKNKEKLLETIEKLKDVKIGEMVVKEIKLKQSELTREGPVYTDIETFDLG